MTEKPKLCIISPWNYPLFNLQCDGYFGGWEVRIGLIAKELARRGRFEVSLVVGDHGQPHVERIAGVTLYSWRGRTIWGIPAPINREKDCQTRAPNSLQAILQSWLRKWLSGQPLLIGQVGTYVIDPKMISIYDEVDADIYTVPGNSQFSGELAYYCRERGKKYVFLSGSDFDYYPEYKAEPEKSDMYGVPYPLKVYAIEKAHAHVVQSEHQAQMLKQGYGRSAIVIRNPIDLTPDFPRNPKANTILWVGKSDERIKRPSIALALASQLPEYGFVIIMNLANPETHQQCLEKAKRLPNVTLLPRVPFAEVERYFANARVHVNTSAFEGFPNTFLQAAKYGVPTLSLQVDPGAMLSQYGCGQQCGGDLGRLKENVRLLMTDTRLYAEMSGRCLDYVRVYHDKEKIISQYEKALADVLG
jgi:glycosyltransferase involved in cell wall biosynthesis